MVHPFGYLYYVLLDTIARRLKLDSYPRAVYRPVEINNTDD